MFPSINSRGSYYLCNSLSELQTEPLLNELKIKTILRSFASFAFLPIISPQILPPIIINWLSRFSSPGTTRHDLGMHYNAEIAPTFILATVYGYQKIKRFLINKKIIFHDFCHKYALVIIAFYCLFLNVWIYKSPALLFFNKEFYAHTKKFEFLDNLVEAVPKEGVIMAQTNLAAKLAYKPVYMLRDNYHKFDPDYIVIDTRDGQEPNNFLGIKDFDQLVKTLQSDQKYEVYYSQGCLLYTSPSPRDRTRSRMPSSA